MIEVYACYAIKHNKTLTRIAERCKIVSFIINFALSIKSIKVTRVYITHFFEWSSGKGNLELAKLRLS